MIKNISSSDEERLIIDKIVEGRNDYYSAKNIAREEGKEEGLKEGKIEGLKEGKIGIAKNMLKEGLDVNLISKLSGLSITEIEDINKN